MTLLNWFCSRAWRWFINIPETCFHKLFHGLWRTLLLIGYLTCSIHSHKLLTIHNGVLLVTLWNFATITLKNILLHVNTILLSCNVNPLQQTNNGNHLLKLLGECKPCVKIGLKNEAWQSWIFVHSWPRVWIIMVLYNVLYRNSGLDKIIIADLHIAFEFPFDTSCKL